MNDGPVAAPPSLRDPASQRTGEWKFSVEISPEKEALPSNSFWIAGWILSATGAGAADVRAWLGHRLFLGLCGLPRPEIETAELGRSGPPHAGFSFLLQPETTAPELRLEVCDEHGRWQEFYRRAFIEKPTAPTATTPLDRDQISRALLRLLIARKSQPSQPWKELADEAVREAASVPLNALPNPPFFGRLELPKPVANVRFGLLEISGWIAHRTTRIARLLAFIGPNPAVTLLHGRPRSDVGDIFGELRDGPTSQFAGFIGVPRDLPQPLSLRIFAELENGERHLVFNQRFFPGATVESPESLPPFSRLTFARAALALWSSAKRHDLSLGSIADFRRQAAPALEIYRSEAPVKLVPSITAAETRATRLPSRLEVILVTHNLNREGAPLIALEHAKFLAAQPGWKVRVVSPETGPLASDFAAAGLSVETLDTAALWKIKSSVDFDSALRALTARCDWDTADLIIANTMVSFWAIHVAHRLRKPSLLYVHESSSVRRFFAALAAPPLFPKIEAAFGLATAVVFSASAAQKSHLRHQRRGNFRVVPGWIDAAAISAYTATHSRAEIRRAKNIPENAVVFANLGSVSERKGQHVFVDAIARLQSRRRSQTKTTPPLVFLMVGATAGPLVDFLRHEISRRRLEEVHIVEKVADPYAYFRLADVFVGSSFEESLPRVVLEAAAFGLPIVTTAVNGVPEILGPDDAWLVPPGDADRLADAMESALESVVRNDRSRADRAQRQVREQFDAARLLPRHAALAANVVAPRAN